MVSVSSHLSQLGESINPDLCTLLFVQMVLFSNQRQILLSYMEVSGYPGLSMRLGRCLRLDGRHRLVSWWHMQALFGCLVAPVQLFLSDILG